MGRGVHADPARRSGEPHDQELHPARDGHLWRWNAAAIASSTPSRSSSDVQSIDPKTGQPTYDHQEEAGAGQSVTFCPALGRGLAAGRLQQDGSCAPANENLQHAGRNEDALSPQALPE
jgi:hypothetical protein